MPTKNIFGTTNERGTMSTSPFALAALLLGVAGAASAGVPVIELTPTMGAPVYSVQGEATQPGVPGMLRAQARPELAGPRQPAASASAVAGTAYPIPSSAAGMLVAERPQPPAGALWLLLAACIVYLARHRGPGFALRPTRALT